MNTFFLTQSRDMIFESKKSSMQNQATIMTTALSALDSLTEDGVSQAMSLLDVQGLSSVTILDNSGYALYKSSNGTDELSSSFFDRYFDTAKNGNDIFYSSFREGAFSSSVFAPIMKHGITTGIVYIYEYDAAEGQILTGLQNTIKYFSILISIVAVAVLIYLFRTILVRFTNILTAIATVREGEYNYRIEVKGNDEITRLSNEFNSLTARLQKTDEMRRRFVADASHELKTPLASIRLLSDSILQNEDMDPDTVRDFVSDIGTESERLARTTEKLLSLTKLDSHLMREENEVDLRESIASTLRMLKPLADAGGITLQSELDGGCIVLSTSDDVHQIVFNLIENAIKYNNPDGNVKVILSREEKNAVIRVEDTGIGIPDEDMPFIFDRFYRVDKARSREAGGSGLGLAIVKATVLEHRGDITAERKEDGGMRFTVTFPLHVSGDY